MKFFLTIFKKYRWHLLVVLLIAAGTYYYFSTSSTTDEAAASFYVVDTVDRGEVTSGIETTGEIVAAQQLSIDVYKQLSRIDVVNVANGSHVEAGDVLLSFDKNDAYVDARSAEVAVAEAELKLETEQESATDPNTEITTLKNQILGYEKTIADATTDIDDAYINFLNADLEVEQHKDRYYTTQSDRTSPTLSGRYVSDIEGSYTIEVYASGADSGFSYRVTGLETKTDVIIFGKALDIGERGLKITFPTNINSGDKWVVSLPNKTIATYNETKVDYETTVATLEKNIRDAKVSIENATQEIATLERTDTTNYRDLSVQQAEASLQEAEQRLSQNYDVVDDRDIVAPFSGTVEGMENVVVGATPTGGESDTINLGTLISDEFLTTFTLSATDVAKVSVGQKVKVTVTSFTEQPVFEATITEISSLPEESGVAQYEVRAQLTYDRTTATLILREGMLADIEVVQNENLDALRVPTSAITYEQGVPKVTLVDSLTEEQKLEVERMGIIRTTGSPVTSYSKEVTLGIVGQYYTEILSGLSEGDIIITTSLTETTDESVVGEGGFAPPSGDGGERPTDGPPSA